MTIDTADDEHGLKRPDHTRDPYAAFARLRRDAPVSYSDHWKGWVVTRYADVMAAFRHPGLSADRMGGYTRVLPPPILARVEPLLRNFGRWITMMDAPDHPRIRSLLAGAFSPRFVEQLRPRIAALVDQLLDAVAGQPAFDVVASLAYPLPVLVIGEMLGLPPADQGKLKVWSDRLAGFLGMASPDPQIIMAAVQAVVEMEAYFQAVIDDRRAHPGDDLVSLAVNAHDEGGRLSAQELVSSCCMLLFAGHETTTNLIANCTMLLLQHPEQAALLRAEPGRIDAAIEETLRYETPVLRMGRVSVAPVELAGGTIPPGQRVFLVMGAANRDADQFPDPDRFDITRPDLRHLALGHGAHYCLGAALGRLEARLALPALLRRFPDLRLADGFDPAAEWFENQTIRGLHHLPVLTGQGGGSASAAS